MLSSRLVRMIEEHAEQLTGAVLDDLGRNPLTPAYHKLRGEELRRRIYEVFHNFARWLVRDNDAAMENWYGELGSQRSAEGIPLSEVTQALILTKLHLQEYIRSVGLADSALDLYQQLEIHRLIGRFFDKAIYFTAKGYEREAPAPLGTVAAERVR
jgi:hypothetical protein